MGVVDRGRETRLALEALAKALIAGELGRHDLERDGALEAQLGGAIDDAHAAAAKFCLDAAAGEGWVRELGVMAGRSGGREG